MQFHAKIFWFIWFHEFFCLDFFKFSGPLCGGRKLNFCPYDWLSYRGGAFWTSFRALCIMYNLVKSLVLLWIGFLWKWEEKNELNVNIRDGSDMDDDPSKANRHEWGIFFWWRRKWVYVLDFEKGWLWCGIFELRLPATFQRDMI